MSGFWGRRRREREATSAQDADLAQRAKSALVAVDERIRVTGDELVFAEAELGATATAPVRAALEAVRTHLAEAFHLHQLNHDEIPDTPEELRTRNARIVQLCEWAEDLLEDRTSALEADISRVRRAPEVVAAVRADAERLRRRVPGAEESVRRLSSRYSDAALRQVAQSPAEAGQLLDFAVHSADVSERRREAARNEEANLALETATEAIRRAGSLLDGVDDFEIEALRAESTLADVVADSREDLLAARRTPRTPEIDAAAGALQDALDSLAPAGSPNDPFAELSRLREANSALDAAVEKARQRRERPLPSPEHVRHSLDDADRQIAVARSVIAGHRGWIGADARTRLAEAERARADVDRLPDEEDSREQAFALGRRGAQLASEALQLAQRDIDSSRPQDDSWGGWGGGPGPRQGGGGGGGMGALLGGMVLGGLLGDIFD